MLRSVCFLTLLPTSACALSITDYNSTFTSIYSVLSPQLEITCPDNANLELGTELLRLGRCIEKKEIKNNAETNFTASAYAGNLSMATIGATSLTAFPNSQIVDSKNIKVISGFLQSEPNALTGRNISERATGRISRSVGTVSSYIDIVPSKEIEPLLSRVIDRLGGNLEEILPASDTVTGKWVAGALNRIGKLGREVIPNATTYYQLDFELNDVFRLSGSSVGEGVGPIQRFGRHFDPSIFDLLGLEFKLEPVNSTARLYDENGDKVFSLLGARLGTKDKPTVYTGSTNITTKSFKTSGNWLSIVDNNKFRIPYEYAILAEIQQSIDITQSKSIVDFGSTSSIDGINISFAGIDLTEGFDFYDHNGNGVFGTFGKLESTVPIPIPASFPLLVTSLCLLSVTSRRIKNTCR